MRVGGRRPVEAQPGAFGPDTISRFRRSAAGSDSHGLLDRVALAAPVKEGQHFVGPVAGNKVHPTSDERLVTGFVIDRVGPDLKAGIVSGPAEFVGDVAVIEIDADGAETKGRGDGAGRGLRRFTVGGRRTRAVIEQEMDVRGEPADFTGPGGVQPEMTMTSSTRERRMTSITGGAAA